MRRLFTFATVLMVGTAMMAQNRVFRGNPQIQKMELRREIEGTETAQRIGPVEQGTGMTTASVSKLLSLPNSYGYSIHGNQHQLTAYPELNSVAFCNRQDPGTYGGGSGDLRYNLSTDKGVTWANSGTTTIGGVINPLGITTGPARYPNSILFTNGGNTVNDLKLHVVAPTLDPATNSGWVNQLNCTVESAAISGPSGAYTSQEEYNFSATGIFACDGNITERVHNSGEFWMVCDNINDTSLYVFKGAYGPLAGTPTLSGVNWTIVDTLNADWLNITGDGARARAGVIAFSPDGQKGYVATIGDVAGFQDTIDSPIIWSYDNVTGKFGPAEEIDINASSVILDYLESFTDTSGAALNTERLCTASGDFDLTVDSDGNPHFATLILGTARHTSGGGNYYFSTVGMRQMDLHIMNGKWYATPIADQNVISSTQMGSGANTFTEYVQPILSRSLDGKFIFYTWPDGDTTASKLDAPDMFGRMLDVTTNKLTPSVNWTLNDPNWHTRARSPKTSEYVFETASASACGRVFEVPSTIINYTSTTDLLTSCDIYYFTDISYTCEAATIGAEDILLEPIISIQPALGMSDMKVYPNPTRSTLNVEMKLAKQENVTISLINVNGQTVMSKVVENVSSLKERFNVANLASGLYFLQVTNSKGTQAQKVVID